MGSLHKNIQLMLEILKAPFLVVHFSYYTLVTFLVMLSEILLSMLMILLSILSVIRQLIWGNNLNWFLNLKLIYETLCTDAKSGLLISMLGKLNRFYLTSLITLVQLMWKWNGSVLEDILGLTLSSKLDRGSYIISIAKTLSKNIGTLIRSMKFFSPELALYPYHSTIRPCLEYCFHAWTGAPICYLE